MTRTREAIDRILAAEGGFVNHRSDRGGPTNFGITQLTLAQWRGKQVTIDDVRALTRDEAAAIYESLYITRPGLHKIKDDDLFAYVADMAANHGVTRAVLILQKAIGNVVQDGDLGPKTLAAMEKLYPSGLLLAVRIERMLFYARITRDRPANAAFLVGWTKRCFA